MYALVDNVFRFEVPVDDLVLVHVVKSPAGLTDYVSGHVFRDSSSLLQKTIELSGNAQLHSQVYKLLVREETVHLYDVGVVQEHLDLDLPQQLHCQLAINLSLLYLFQGANET